MSFFKLSTGADASQNATGQFESGGGQMDPIPAGTQVLASCEESSIQKFGDDQFVNIRWRVAKPEEYKNRVVFQKVRCWDADVAKRDRALLMLAAIDANAGGKIAKAGQEPNDFILQQSLVGHPMVLKLDVWEMDGKSGNWVQAVSPIGGQKAQAEPVAPAPQSEPDVDIDTIPF